MNKNKIIALVILLILVVGAVHFFTKEIVTPVVVVPDEKTETREVTLKEVCYFKETTGGEFEGTVITDSAFTSINYDSGGKVHGVINWIPGEKDSLVGTYTGVVEKSDVPGYSTRLNIIYVASGEGIINRQQEILIVGRDSIKTGIGEKYQDENGVFKFKNTNSLSYDNALPQVDCGSVPERIKTDYSKSQ